jgi:hypothetical protein
VTYSIAYTVAAATRLEAIEKAVAMLRRDVRLRGVGEVTQVGDRWTVCLSVWEDA